MDSKINFQNGLEDLKAMILAADLRDPKAVARLGLHVQDILGAASVATPETELLGLVLSVLQSAGSLGTASTLRVVASAVAELSQQFSSENSADRTGLEAATDELREMLRSLGVEPAPAKSPDRSARDATPSDPWREDAFVAETVEVDAQILAEFVAESYDRISLAEAATLSLERDPHDCEAINTVLRAFHTIKGASGLLGLREIQNLAHHAEDLLIRGRDGEIQMVGRPIDLALQSCDALKFMVGSVENQPPGHVPDVPKNYRGLLDALSARDSDWTDTRGDARANSASWGTAASTSAETAELGAADAWTGSSLSESGMGLQAEESAAGQRALTSAAAAEASVRVNTERLDNLVNLVGELVIAQAIVAQDSRIADDSSSRLGRSVASAGKITRQLQDLAMSLRMVPLKGTFQKMTRLVRDLAHKSEKAIEFHITGEDTEIDRNMVELLNDPLAHMIRNAVDHGIERTADRVALGKSATGTIHLRAYHAAGNVVIELKDDGKGLHRERIVQRAIQRGLVEPDCHLTDDEAHFLIFHPGLSTAENVTEISGRGVGLDVVKRSVESLRGRIELTTAPGKGTTFTLRMPLTTAIIDAMTVSVGRQQYLLPTVVIERSFRPEPGDVSSVAGRGEMVIVHGQVLPLFRLHRLFQVPDAQQDPQRALVVVIEGAGRRCVVMVDELLGQQQAVMKTLGNSLSHIPGVAGGAILSDGRVGLILDAAGLVRLAHGQQEGVHGGSAMGVEGKSHTTNRTILQPGSRGKT